MVATLVVEDETGLEDANSYSTLAEFKTYWDNRGYDYSSDTDDQISIALIKATDYIENRFRTRFRGSREFDDQSLSFPRLYLYDEDGRLVTGLPIRLKNATIEYTKRALTAELASDPIALDDSGMPVTMLREKVGPIETETQYSAGSAIVIYKPYPSADALLQEYITASGGKATRT